MMATTKSGHQPIRLSEYINVHNKSSDKKLHKSRMEPVRIKDLLLSSSKARSSSADRPSRRTKLFAVPKQTVRRALYGTSPSPSQSTSSQSSIETKNSAPVSKTRTPLIKRNKSILPQVKSRQSMLPQPNFIVKKNKQKVVDNSPAIPTVIEERLSEVMKLTPQQHQRATVIKSVHSKRSSVEKNKCIDDCEIVNIEYNKDNNNKNRLIDLETSIVDKENIPPDNLEPLTNDETCKSNNVDNRINLDSFQDIRIEKIEQDLKIIKEQQSLLIDLVQKVLNAMSIKSKNDSENQVSETKNVCCVPSSPLIPLISVTSDDKENNSNNKNTINNYTSDNSNNDSVTVIEKKQRKSLPSIEERRRSARIASKLTPRKNDSFKSLENELNIVHLNSKPPSPPITPKNDNPIFKSKSARTLREYMAMKASMTFLETPDANGFRRAINYGDDTPARNKSVRRTISSNVLNELKNLYDSEEAEYD